MVLTEENKKDIMNAFMISFTKIIDKNYQQRVWIQGEGPECDDFTETVCELYEVGESVLDDYKTFNITDQQYHLLKKFMCEFRHFSCQNNYPEEFIDTMEWDHFINMAQEILVAFNYQKDSQSFS